MPIRRGGEYLESLRDGRRLWLMGQRVADVTAHPALAGCARSVAAVYDLQHDVLQHIRELCGPGILMAPGEADLHHPEIGPHLHRFFVARDDGASERFRLFKLAWEYACDSFGSRQLLFEMYNVGSLATNKQRLASSYDTRPCVALARELAGISEPAARWSGQAAHA